LQRFDLQGFMFEEVVSQDQRLAGFCFEEGDGFGDGFCNVQ